MVGDDGRAWAPFGAGSRDSTRDSTRDARAWAPSGAGSKEQVSRGCTDGPGSGARSDPDPPRDPTRYSRSERDPPRDPTSWPRSPRCNGSCPRCIAASRVAIEGASAERSAGRSPERSGAGATPSQAPSTMFATSTSPALATAALTWACTCGRFALGSAAEVLSTSRRSRTAARASANASRAWRLLARLCSVAASAFARSKARSRGFCMQRGATDLPKTDSVRSNGAVGRPPAGDVERV